MRLSFPAPLLSILITLPACGDDPSARPEADVASEADAGPVDTTPGDADAASPAPDAAPDAAQPADTGVASVDVSFVVTIPVETRVGTAVKVLVEGEPGWSTTLDCGLTSRRCTGALGLPAGLETSLRLELADGRRALALDGSERAPEPLTLPGPGGGNQWTAQVEVERWGTPGEPAAAVAFIVRPPASTPPQEAIHVSGSLPALGSWDGRGLRLEPGREGVWAAVATFAEADVDFAFKVTRGSWYTVEKGSRGEEIANRGGRVEPGRLVRVEASPARWADLLDPGTGTLTGEVRRWADVASTHLEATRDVLVWLPPGYREELGRTYPVLYAHDGQNLMDAETAFGGFEWGLDEALDAAVRAGDVPPFIAVAVGNSSDRIDEYTPTSTVEYGGGGLPDYGRFLVEELKPQIDAHFRTRRAASDTGVMGSSLGGLASVWLGLEHPGVFGRLGVVSPSVWWDDRAILDDVAAFDGPPTARVWVDIGTDEGSGDGAVADARALRDALVARGWTEGGDLSYREFEGAGHNEGAWAARLPQILRFLLAGP